MTANDPQRTPFSAVLVDVRGPSERSVLDRGRCTLDRWRRAGLKLTVIVGNAVPPDLADGVTVRHVPSEDDSAVGSQGLTHLYREATLAMGCRPSDTLALVPGGSAITAARELGFRRVVGLAADGDFELLLAAGADSAIDDLTALRFPRTLPSALDCLDEIAQRRGRLIPVIFLDFDGTLSPIVPHPADAALAPGMREIVAGLAERFTVAVISGRDREDVAQRVNVDGLCYAGSHGLDIEARGRRFTPDQVEPQRWALETLARELNQTVAEVPGVVLEHKRFSLAVHTRQVKDPAQTRWVNATVERAAAGAGLRLQRGKQVREICPDVDWHKGRAVTWLLQAFELDRARSWPLYFGDDETDEDAFRVVQQDGIGLRPGPAVAASLADYRLPGVDGVRRFLRWLASQDI